MKVFYPEKEDMVEPPQWFIDYVLKTYDYLGFESRPVLEIISAEYKIYLDHAPMRESFEDILRTYTIKQDTLQPLDTKEHKSIYDGKLSQEALDKGAEALRSDCLHPLDVEKIIQELMEMCEWHFEVEDPETVELGIRKTLSKYGAPKITKDEVKEYLGSYTDSEFVQIVVLNFLDSKGLLDKSK